MPHNEAEYLAFVADLIGCGRGYADRLRVDHLAHHAAGAVRRAHKHRIEAELLRRNALQAAEQGIGRRIAAGERHSQPSEEGSEEWIEAASACEGQSQNGIEAGVARYIAETEHE